MTPARSHLWLPFTQMRAFDASLRTFVRGEGTTLVDSSGARVYDAVSSIWTTLHGHGHPRIVEAIAKQAVALDHATTLGATNPVAEELARRLCAISGLDCAFFASDGASAIEAALKMALQYWQNVGQPQRTRFVRLVDAYHGDTVGAMSISDIGLFKSRFESVTFEAVPYDDVTSVLGDDVAAVIVEPLVQAAAGIRIVPAQAYEALKSIDALLIVDEIATGFGRTGTMFAFEQLGLKPDLLCLGKGISGGTLALSATLATERIYDAFLGDHMDFKHFFHGHSYAGNPIACAAALASLQCFSDEGTLERVAGLAKHSTQRLAVLEDHPRVREVRQAGLMIGVVLDGNAQAGNLSTARALAGKASGGDVLSASTALTPGWQIADALYRDGHFTRPIGDVIQFVPPLSSKVEEVDSFFDALEKAIA